jgi:hypothetical protein
MSKTYHSPSEILFRKRDRGDPDPSHATFLPSEERWLEFDSNQSGIDAGESNCHRLN